MTRREFTPTVRPRRGEPVVELSVGPGRALRLPVARARELADRLREAATEAEWGCPFDLAIAEEESRD